MGRGAAAVKSVDDFLASVADVKAFAERRGADLLAVGTAHGFTPETPQIHFGRLEEIATKISVPLVLHGGTGIPDEDIQKSIKLGINKINIGTIVHTTYTQQSRVEQKLRRLVWELILHL